MAGAGWRTFTAGAVLTAAQVQTYLADQSVQVHASAAARSATLGTAVATGMVSYRSDGTAVEFYNGSAWVALGTGSGDVTQTGAQTLTNKTLTSPWITGGTLSASALQSPIEPVTVSATAATGTVNFDVATQAVLYYTNAATANFTLNFRANSGTTLNAWLTTNYSVTVTFMNTSGASAFYPSAFTIDGTTVTPKWQGGVAPTAGNASAIDVYTLAITKTASATYTVLASQTKFA